MSSLHFLSEVLALVVLISYACTEVCRPSLLHPPTDAPCLERVGRTRSWGPSIKYVGRFSGFLDPLPPPPLFAFWAES